MARTVTVLPPTINKLTSAPIGSPTKRKVAAYARVSTDHEEQQSSYEAQVDYYTKYIHGRDEWEFAGIYSDEGITGTCMAKREGFTSMVEDALAGKIDLIITKSVSRFARNTVDSLTTIRKLKDHGTEVYFEKESIWTFDAKGEMLLTILSSLSQEESRSISENVRWGQRKKFSDGKFSMCYSRFLGYDKGEDGTMVINPEEAETVKLIYGEFVAGYSCKAIAKKLTEMKIPTPGGQEKWYEGTVRSILKNEKYMGCALLQKTYTKDFLTKEVVKNQGEVQQYYVEDSHPAIIEPEQHQLVQDIFAERAMQPRGSSNHPFSARLKCGCCGAWFGAKSWHTGTKYQQTVWQCNAKYKKKDRKCKMPHLTEEQIREAFLRMVNALIDDRDFYLSELKALRETYADTSELEKEKRRLDEQLILDAEAVQKLIDQNARVAQSQTEYNERYTALVRIYEENEHKRDELAERIQMKNITRRKFDRVIQTIEENADPITEFREEMWAALVDHVTVFSKTDFTFTLNSGTEIKA